MMTATRYSRRRAIALLGGFSVLGLVGAGCSRLPGTAIAAGPPAASVAASVAPTSAGATGGGSTGPGVNFPAWVDTMPRGRAAYTAAHSRLDVMAALPCYCGCGVFQAGAHTNLKDCFITPAGEIEPHAAFCETCQDEALDAADWSDAGLPIEEVHRRIVAAYSDRGPATPGEHE
ncbi:MAG: hypothetical protein IT306_09985 [Chloroflexi bacterium]|nr:hypothetical protein [Chloroflexota bacterium]